MRCIKCGTDNPQTARFCGSCGTMLSPERTEFQYVPPPPAPSNRAWMVGTIVASSLAVLLLVTALVGYGAMRSDLTKARSDTDSERQELTRVRSELAHETALANETQSKLNDSRHAFAKTAQCLKKMFDAWFNTIHLSYTSTGFALERAVNSGPCTIPRAAYRGGSI
jgi:zinc-ribbon domain